MRVRMRTAGGFGLRASVGAAVSAAVIVAGSVSACGGDNDEASVFPDGGRRVVGGDAAGGNGGAVSDGGAPDADAAVAQPCSGDGLAYCQVGRCTLSGEASSLPPGTVVTLTDQPLDPALATDALFPYECGVALPPGVDAGAVAFTLSMAVPSGATLPATGALMFSWTPPEATALGTSGVVAGAVQGVIAASGTFGVTRARPTPSLSTQLDVDVRSSADLPSLIRNISGGVIYAAFYDGVRLYIGSGARVLIYNNGIPADPSVKPDVVLGQPDLDSSLSGTSASIFDYYVSAIWSNGTKLVVGTGARTLVWNTVPTASFTPADLVLGQPDFSSDIGNNGGISAASSDGPTGIDSDGTRLAITDQPNHRVLVWSAFPTTINQPATSVIGQPTFASHGIEVGQTPIYEAWDVALDGAGAFLASEFTGTLHTASATTNDAPEDFQVTSWSNAVQPTKMCETWGLALTSAGGLAAVDACGRRIGMWRTKPTGTTPMDFTLGQTDTRVANSHPVSASALLSSSLLPGVRGENGKLLVHDQSRVLVWDTEPTYAFEPASRVIGQPGFTTDDSAIDYRSISATSLGYPVDVASAGGTVAVADRGNNRVLLYSTTGLVTDAAASVVLGQPDFTSFIPNLDQVTPSAARLSGPAGVALDGTHLIVADTENHRVLVWNQVPTASGTPADIVLGQADFTGRRPNRGRGDTDADGHSDAALDGFFAPTGVASDGTHLFVADRVNHRVLVWTTFPTTSGQAASGVLGQPTASGIGSNAGAGPDAVSPLSFQLPSGLALDGTTLYVADTENNRVVRIASAATAPVATAWIGQSDGSSVSDPNFYPQSAANAGYALTPATSVSTVLRPRGLVVAGGRLYVSEGDSNRVQAFDATSLAPLGLLGQTDPTSAAVNAGGISASSASSPGGLAADGDRLYLADTGNNRVLAWPLATPPATDAAATLTLGQPTFANAEFDNAVAPSAGGSPRPRGLAVNGGDLFYTEADHNRVVVTAAPPTAGGGTLRLFGQPNDNLFLPNSGGTASASTLSSPRGVFADATHVVIADTGNNRVLVYDRSSPSLAATLVLGQTDLTSTQANAAGTPSASTLSAPEGVYSDGTRFYVADTGNNRVLEWDAFPTASGQPASHVLGQADFASVLPNRGGAVGPSTLVSPTAVDVAGGYLYIADSANNRVLRFPAPPFADGASAELALGQVDLMSRAPGSVAADPTTLAGPVQLADDGERLYICDRDLGRVIAYPLVSTASVATAADAGAGGDGGADASSPVVAPVAPVGSLAFPLGTDTLSGPDGLAVERTPQFTSRLYIANTFYSRVDVIEGVTRLSSP